MGRKKNRSKKKAEATADDDTEKKTPYQGDRRSFGEFQCDKCENHWYSANSWANMGQKCEKCNIYVYPHKQWALERRGGGNGDKKRHLTELCEKCQKIGINCARAFVRKKAVNNINV